MEQQKKTVLVVDDMAAILEHARQILKDDYKVIPCTSAAQALEVMAKLRPDVILTDINMPDTDGFEFVASVRNNDSFKDIPVIMLTAELTADIENRGFETGADDFILKPFSQAIVLKKVSNQLALR